MAKNYPGILCRQGAADRQCGLEMRPDAALEDLQKFAAEGFSVLGFPCNQFLGRAGQ